MQREVSRIWPPMIFGGLSILSAIICLAFPETKGRSLPEDIHDADPGPLLRRILPVKHYHSWTGHNEHIDYLTAAESTRHDEAMKELLT